MSRRHVVRKTRQISFWKRIGIYLWIGLVDPAPPRLPRSRPLD